MRRSQHPQRHPERGVVIIWTAFFLMMMLGFVAVGIDVAKLMTTRTQLQNAADAAALAGASAINPTSGVLQPDTATVRAQAIAALNKAFTDGPTAIALASADVVINLADNTVQATVRRDAASGGSMITHVAQVVGVKSLDMSATATAKADPAEGVCETLVPMGAIDPTGVFRVGCDTTYVLKTNQINSPGNFQLLDFPDCSEGPCSGVQGGGGAEIRCEVANGYSCCIEIGQPIQTMPGGKIGPFMQGLNDRWDRDTDRREGICYEDYRGNGNRIVNVPMFTEWDPNGKKQVVVRGFLAFFLQRRPSGGELRGQFLHSVTTGTAGSGSIGDGPVVLHLIK